MAFDLPPLATSLPDALPDSGQGFFLLRRSPRSWGGSGNWQPMARGQWTRTRRWIRSLSAVTAPAFAGSSRCAGIAWSISSPVRRHQAGTLPLERQWPERQWRRPSHMPTQVKSETHGLSGVGTGTLRAILSGGPGRGLSCTVVACRLREWHPEGPSPSSNARKGIVKQWPEGSRGDRAWGSVAPSRRGCRQTFRAPWPRPVSSTTHRVCGGSAAPRFALLGPVCEQFGPSPCHEMIVGCRRAIGRGVLVGSTPRAPR